MKALWKVQLALVLVLLLAACGGTAQFTFDGDWLLTARVTESTIADINVGETDTGNIRFASSGNTIRLVDPETNEVAVSGTRSGNTVTFTDGFGGTSVTMTVNLTSNNAFTGRFEGRFEDGAYVQQLSGTRIR